VKRFGDSRENNANLLQTSANFFTENGLEGILLHTNHINGCKFALGNSDYELHTDEGASYDNETFAFLGRYFFRQVKLQYMLTELEN
jgi:hypothetical protein